MDGIIVIDKPSGWTSHDVVGKLRGLLKERRVGHGGTLDPMATGVLPVFVGRATRAASLCENAEKEYIAGFRPGIVTDTQDTTGTILQAHNVKISSEDILKILPQFTGEISQLPPMYSAVKVKGKKLYELARRGVEIERQPRQIIISRLELAGNDGGDFILKVKCSKGTYIRTLCHDIGTALGCGGCMSSLRRIAAGSFSENQAVTLSYVEEAAKAGMSDDIMLPIDSLFQQYPSYKISGRDEFRCRNGCRFKAPVPDGMYRVYGEDAFLMVGKCTGGIMETVKNFALPNSGSKE